MQTGEGIGIPIVDRIRRPIPSTVEAPIFSCIDRSRAPNFKSCAVTRERDPDPSLRQHIGQTSARHLETCYASFTEPQEKLLDGFLSTARFYNTSTSKLYKEIRTVSSQAGPKSSGEDDDDLEDGFSDLETPNDLVQETVSGDENSDGPTSDSELSEEVDADDMQRELEVLGTETDVGERKSTKKRATSVMTSVFLAAPSSPVSEIMDKWVEEGNSVTQADVSICMIELRKRRLFARALQLSDWLESSKHIDFIESNYASRVDLIAKVRGLQKAEAYIEQIPESSRGELVYRTLLANSVFLLNTKKTEEIFNKMKSLGLPITCFSCNQLLLLYKRTDKKKIADVLLLMEKENIKPSHFTYQVLIDVKGKSRDISGMEQIVQAMRAEGVKPSTQLLASVARHYVTAGLKDKAETVLKELEGDGVKENPWVSRWLLPIYASLGREDEVGRIWKVCEANPKFDECMAAIEAWGQLNKIKNAEAALDKILEKTKRPTSKHFSALLRVYANHKLLAKGKELVKRMGQTGCTVGPLTWDALVKLYVGAGEVEKADSILEKVVSQKKGRPLYTTYFAVMDGYAKRGDVHNAEKLFLKIKRDGYVPGTASYHSLLQAYRVAKVPAYGFRERMKADNVFLNRALAAQLDRASTVQKSTLSELLE
ncbi:pentatricopeptide repeat-containing protein mitochondrial-like [Dorcoceras hygrometricum]|uniref:Pentatricopeptide repeat-containing protein mitochondrial-like n=1 Tax=Dorcoceras hygrometricum TaxID=472368 RepID=A0A2Z7AMU6_9LAMI|nr:pentatricopeptide repeat-containing protein mitochondrial-like [Dorcoceras hygrometricum]